MDAKKASIATIKQCASMESRGYGIWSGQKEKVRGGKAEKGTGRKGEVRERVRGEEEIGERKGRRGGEKGKVKNGRGR